MEDIEEIGTNGKKYHEASRKAARELMEKSEELGMYEDREIKSLVRIVTKTATPEQRVYIAHELLKSAGINEVLTPVVQDVINSIKRGLPPLDFSDIHFENIPEEILLKDKDFSDMAELLEKEKRK